MLAAYVDESGNDELFTLSCVVAECSAWLWFEMDWQKRLDDKNAQLKSENRKTVSRYHASDCSSRFNEFHGWTPPEQIAFFQTLLSVFGAHVVNTIAYTISLREFVEEMPETADDPKKPAYALLLKYLMIEIGNNILAREKDQLVTIIHDRAKGYNQTLLSAFDAMCADETFKYRNRFSSITAMSWEHCIPLQPADLLAYENFKEVERGTTKRSRRKSLEAILSLEATFGGKCAYIPREGIREIRDMLEAAKFKAAQAEGK